jgi:hypothetical protein
MRDDLDDRGWLKTDLARAAELERHDGFAVLPREAAERPDCEKTGRRPRPAAASLPLGELVSSEELAS